jgi:HK97 gp10 family phage protein
VSDYKELEGLRARLMQARRGIRTAVMSEMDKAAEEVKMKMREEAPVDTGALRDSIAVVKQGGDHWTIGPVGIEYAAAQEYGAKPHVIVASAGKVLAFQVGGQQKFAKSVKHPGNKPQPYIRPAADWAREQLSEEIQVIGNSMLSGKHHV